MAWVQLSNGFFSNPKVLRAGRDARDLYLAALCYCNEALTDGFVPAEALRRLAADADVDDPKGLAARLVAEGLWVVVDGGWAVHDYLRHQRSRSQVTADKESNARRQAAHRQRQRAGNGETDAQSPGDRNADRNGVTHISHDAPSNAGVTTVETEEKENVDDAHALRVGAREAEPPPRQKRPSPLPDDWEPSAADLTWLEKQGWPAEFVAWSTAQFRDGCAAKRLLYVDFSAAWKKWLRGDWPGWEQKRARAAPNGRASPTTAVDWQDVDAVLGA